MISGPVFGGRSTEWLTNGWVDNVPSLGWEDTVAYLSIPVMLVIAQSVSLRILTPPSDDPAMQQSQRILKYLPLMIGYFSLSVPAGLGIYWVINNILSTVTTGIALHLRDTNICFSDTVWKLALIPHMTFGHFLTV